MKIVNLLRKIVEKRNQVFIGIMLISIVLWITFIFVEGTSSIQYNLFFLRTGNFLADFLNNIGFVRDRNPYFDSSIEPAEHLYPPLAYIIFYFFSRITIFPTGFLQIYYQSQFTIIFFIFAFFVLFLFSAFLITIYRNNAKNSDSNMEEILLVFCLIFSYPVIYTIERGNILLLTITLVSGYFAFNDSSSKILRELSLIFLAMAFALKLTPAIFGLLLLCDKRFLDAIRCALYGIAFFIMPFFFFDGGLVLNFRAMLKNIGLFTQKYKDAPGLGINDTVKLFVKRFSGGEQTLDSSIESVIRICTIIICIIFIIDVFIVKDQWKKMFLMALIAVLLPSHVNTYCIIYFIPVTLIFLITAEKNIINFVIMIIQCGFYSTFIYGFSDCYYNLIIPFFAVYFTIDSIINIRNTMLLKKEK